MNEVFFNTIKTVFALAAMQGKKLCFSRSDGQFYEVTDRDADGCTLYPVGGVGGSDNSAPIFHLNPDELLFAEDLLTNTPKNAFQTLTNAFETLSKRDGNANNNAAETPTTTRIERTANVRESTNNAPETSMQRPVIGRGKVDLPRFSHLYAGDIADKCAEIESLLDKILTQTNYAPTIKKTIGNYQTANKLAKDGNLFELSILADRLRGRINKQNAMSTAMDTVAARQAARRKMTLSLTLMVVGFAVFLGWKWYAPTVDESTTVDESPAVAVVPESVFDAAIEEWQRNNNRKIYPAGRECLRQACAGLTDKDVIMKIINDNMK